MELKDLAGAYGEAVAHYSGEGRIFTTDDVFTCRFEAAQLQDGDIILLCSAVESSNEPGVLKWPFPSVERFEGTATDGTMVSADQNFLQTNALSASGDPFDVFAFRTRRLIVTNPVDQDVRQVRYGLTNLLVSDTTRGSGDEKREILPLQLDDTREVVPAEIVSLDDYEEKRLRLKTLHSVSVTAEVALPVNQPGNEAVNGDGPEPIALAVAEQAPTASSAPLLAELDGTDKRVTALSYVLSVARGTKVQWIYRDLYNANGECAAREHRAHVTRGYSTLAVIEPRWTARRQAEFIERAFRVFHEREEVYGLRRLIDAYVEAKQPTDFIETRGLKVAVGLEALKHAYAEDKGWEGEYYIEPKRLRKVQKKLRAAIRAALEESGVSGDEVDEILAAGTINGLIRKTFAQVVQDLATEIGLAITEGDMSAFSKSRNVLVHQGRFVSSALSAEKLHDLPFDSPWAEYLFDVHFLDRIFLRLFDYDGEYVDSRDVTRRTIGMLQPRVAVAAEVPES